MNKYLTSKSALMDIGARLKAYRIDFPLSQEALSEKSGISIRSISRMENGEDIQFGNLIKILIALNLDANLDLLVPDPKRRPSNYLNNKVKQRQRVRIKSTNINKKQIKWGDEKV